MSFARRRYPYAPVDWKRMYSDLQAVFPDVKQAIDEGLQDLRITIDRKEVLVINETPYTLKISENPTLIAVDFDDIPARNIYGQAIMERIWDARANFLSQVATRFGLKARLTQRGYKGALDLYYTPDNYRTTTSVN